MRVKIVSVTVKKRGRNYAVVNTHTGKVEKTYPTESQAKRYATALNISQRKRKKKK